MANWTDIPNANLAAGAPIRSVDILALRDNIIFSRGIRAQVFTSSGTFTVPAGVEAVKVTVIGGGGGGGRGTDASSAGSGGGGGGVAIEYITGLTPAQNITVTVGAGGATGVAGGTSSFGAFCSATGGGAGTNSTGTATTFGAGGAGSGGNINITGGSGARAGSVLTTTGDTYFGGNGGGSGGSNALFAFVDTGGLFVQYNSLGFLGGAGGLGGIATLNSSTWLTAQSGSGYGNGGGGAVANAAGTSGSAGVVIVEW